MPEPSIPEREKILKALGRKLEADLGEIRSSVLSCRRCPGGRGGLPGEGKPGANFLLLASSPGPGAGHGNPWGDFGNALLKEVERSGLELGRGELYFTLALRCPGVKVSAANLRRCALYLAEEIYLVGPRAVIAFGRAAAVALRMALGEDLPARPRAGDEVVIQGKRIVYNLDPSGLGDPPRAEVLRRILKSAFMAV